MWDCSASNRRLPSWRNDGHPNLSVPDSGSLFGRFFGDAQVVFAIFLSRHVDCFRLSETRPHGQASAYNPRSLQSDISPCILLKDAAAARLLIIWPQNQRPILSFAISTSVLYSLYYSLSFKSGERPYAILIGSPWIFQSLPRLEVSSFSYLQVVG